MKIYLAKYDPGRTGGGWTFQRNLAKGLADHITTDYDEADIYFISGATMVSHDEVAKAKRDGKKVVLRVDNAIRNSRNRNTGMTRLEVFCKVADLVIYQSKWAKNFLKPFTQVDGAVILNGVDTEIYNTKDRQDSPDTYLYVRSSRDEGKGWIAAWYWFVNNPGFLEIVGKFSLENIEYNFDFYNGERFRFLGEQSNMSDIYKRNEHFLYTYLNDACSNTLLEALASGCEIKDVYGMLKTGGAPEIMACPDISLDRMCAEYKLVMESII